MCLLSVLTCAVVFCCWLFYCCVFVVNVVVLFNCLVVCVIVYFSVFDVFALFFGGLVSCYVASFRGFCGWLCISALTVASFVMMVWIWIWIRALVFVFCLVVLFAGLVLLCAFSWFVWYFGCFC